jgi:transcriptional regulator with XRE-family HTH domain
MKPIILTTWRERFGWSRAEAARQLGCARNSLAAWENGTAEIPKYIALACSALALNVAPYGADVTPPTAP